MKYKRELKSESIKFRVTPSDRKRIGDDAENKGMELSEYVRSQLEKPREITGYDIEDLRRKISYEIHKIGTNVNQIAHRYNEFGVQEASTELIRYMDEIKIIMNDIDKRLKEIR